MTRSLALVALLLAVAGCSASGVPSPGGGDAGMEPEVPPLQQRFAPGSIAVLHAAVLEPATGERTGGQTVLVLRGSARRPGTGGRGIRATTSRRCVTPGR